MTKPLATLKKQGKNLMLDANKLSQELAERGKTLASAQSSYKQLEDSEKSILAEYTQRAKHNGAKSIAEAEMTARAATEYREFLDEKAKHRGEYLIAQVNYDTMKVYIDMLRSNQSFEKAQMGMIWWKSSVQNVA